MRISRRKAIGVSGAALTGLSLGYSPADVLARMPPQASQPQAAFPDRLIEQAITPPPPLPLMGDGSVQEYKPSEAGAITDPVRWRPPGTQPNIDFDYRNLKIKVDTKTLGKWKGTLRFADLANLPHVTHTFLLQCAAPNPRGIVKWRGVRFRDFADMLELHPGAQWVRFIAADRMYMDENVATLRHPQVLLAWLMNDAPIPPAHGAPLRLIMPFRYGVASVKALTEIVFNTTPPFGQVPA